MSSNDSDQKKPSERIIAWLLHLLAFCGLFLILMAISHSVIAEETPQNQYLIAVFEDHRDQVEASAPYGLSWKLIEAAAITQDINLIKIETTWESAINRLKDSRLDLVFAAYKTKEREQWAQFTLPLASDSSGLFSAIDSPINKIEDVDFEHEMVGVISNSTQEALAREIGFKHIYPAKVRKRLNQLIAKGRVQYVLLGHSSLAVYCKTEGSCLQQVGEPIAINFTRVMGHKDSEKTSRVIESLNNGILAILTNPETQKLFTEFGYSASYYENWRNTVEINQISQ